MALSGPGRVALLMPYIGEEFRSSLFVKELVDGVMLAAAECGCRLDFSAYSNSDSLAIDPSLSGFLLVRPEHDEALKFKRLGLPTILLDTWYPRLGLGCVQTDNACGIRLAVKHLVGLRHRRILYVHNHRPSEPSFSAQERFHGFMAAAKRYGLCTENTVVLVDDLAERLCRADYTAILTDGHDATVRTLRALRERAIRFPDDVSFVGFDDVELAEYMPAPLTVIRQKLDEIGVIGLNHLLDASVDWRRVRTFIKPELVIRQSTRVAGS